MKKKLLILLTALCLALCLLPGKTFASDAAEAFDVDTAETSDVDIAELAGISNDGTVTWTQLDNYRIHFETADGFSGELNDNDTLTITGFSGSVGSDGRLEIPARIASDAADSVDSFPVAAILDGAFADNLSLESVILPEGLIVLGASAFRGCQNLISANLPGTLRYVSFYDNSQRSTGTLLSEYTTHNGISYVLARTVNNESVPSPYAGQYVNATTGRKASSLINPYRSGSIGPYCSPFANTALGKISIPEEIAGEISFGPSSRQIPAFLCYGCKELKHINIPSKVTEVGQYAFGNCTALESVFFDTTEQQLAAIRSYAFYQCPALQSVTFSREIFPQSMTIESYAFYGCGALKNFCISSDGSSFAPPNGLVSLGAMSFASCRALTSVNLPEGVTFIGDRAFGECANLERIYIPATLKNAAAPFAPIPTPDPEEPDQYPVNAGCTKLDNIVFGEGIASIPATLFKQCAGLTHLEIPATVTRIDAQAFMQCTQMKTVVIPDSVTTLGESAFYNSGLTKIEIPDSVVTYGSGALQHCMYLTSARLSAKALEIPANLFNYCIRLKEIDLPYGVTQIQEGTFDNCYALATVTMPETVTAIGKNAFRHCDKLTDISFSENLRTIGDNAFQNCEALEEIDIPPRVSSIGKSAFRWNVSLLHVTLPEKITTLSEYLFANCTALTEITIPKRVRTIGEYAFYQDTALLAATLPASIISNGIPSTAFSYVNRMTIRGAKGTYAQQWAEENECARFEDITVSATSVALANGRDYFTIPRRKWITPPFVIKPWNTTDVLELTSADEEIVRIQNGDQIYGQKEGSTEITAISTSGQSVTITVTVVRDSGINSDLELLSLPARVSYLKGEHVDLDGLQVLVSYQNGDSYLLPSENWTASVSDTPLGSFTAGESGRYEVKIEFGPASALFDIYVYDSAEEYPLWLASAAPNAEADRVSARVTGSGAQDGSLIVGAYDAEGKFLFARTKDVTAAELAAGAVSIPMALEDAAFIKAFFINSSGAPQCGRRVTWK